MTRKELEIKKVQIYAKVGERLHYAYRRGNILDIQQDEFVKESFDEICRIDKEIYNLKNPVAAGTEGRLCPNCKNALDEGAVFCRSCGKNIESFISENLKLCKSCDNHIEISAVFCPVCGSRGD